MHPQPKDPRQGPNLVFGVFRVVPRHLAETLRRLMSAFRRWKSSSPGRRSLTECVTMQSYAPLGRDSATKRPPPDRSNRVRWGWSTLGVSKGSGQRWVAMMVSSESPQAWVRQHSPSSAITDSAHPELPGDLPVRHQNVKCNVRLLAQHILHQLGRCLLFPHPRQSLPWPNLAVRGKSVGERFTFLHTYLTGARG